MRDEGGRRRRRLTPGSTAVTVVVAVVAALLPVGGAAALHQAKVAADAPVPARPASLGSMDFYRALFGATATGVPVTTTPRGNPVRPVLPDDVRAYLERVPAVPRPVEPVKPAEPTLIPIEPPEPVGRTTFTAPLPTLPSDVLRAVAGKSCTEMVHLVNGATSACVSPRDDRFVKAAKSSGVPDGEIWGFTDDYTGEVLISTAVPQRYLLTVMLHERGHQLIELSCLGPLCWRALLKATGNAARLSIYVGPYFTRAHESAAESYAACHGGVPDRRYRIIPCEALRAALAKADVDRANYQADLADYTRMNDANAKAESDYVTATSAYSTALAEFRQRSATYALELQLWQQVHPEAAAS